MLLTEKQASDKNCLKRSLIAAIEIQTAVSLHALNMAKNAAERTGCLGSRCMAWRWSDEYAPSTGEKHVVDLGNGNKKLETVPGERCGYCGAFGAP